MRKTLVDGLLRGAALFAGAFVLIGLAARWRDPALDTSHWLVDLRELPNLARIAGLGILGILAALWGVRGTPLRRLARIVREDATPGGPEHAISRPGAASQPHLEGARAAPERDLTHSGPPGHCATRERGTSRSSHTPFLDPAALTRRPHERFGLAPLALAALAGVAAWDTASVLFVHWRGDVVLSAPPLSLGVTLVLAIAAWRARHAAPAPVPLVVAGTGGAAGAFALALMLCLGTTDYRRPADAVVVLGARAYADGSPSLALADRMRTAAGLVTGGHAPLLIVSGGPGDGAFHETDVMRQIAIDAGVSADRILVDRDGLNTRATAVNATRLLRDRGAASALVVSHAYHLPRVKASFESAGLRVYSVPAAESRTMLKLPWFVARETAAWWVYWTRDRLG